MDIRIRETGEVVQDYGFRSLHENTSFPAVLTDELLAEFGADFIYPGIAPQPLRYQTVYSDGVEQIEGKWYTKYSVAEMDQDAKDAVDAQLKAANEARAKEDLLKTDWSELATVRDTNVSPHLVNTAAFDTYRVALRAIVINPPVDVAEWPARPDAVWSS